MGSDATERSVWLCGMMGSGKSRVGARLAERLDWEWVDTDSQIERETGSTVADLFAAEGEAAFREREHRVLCSLPLQRTVVSFGGGAVLLEQNRALLKGRGRWFWLDADAETLAARLQNKHDRPLLPADSTSRLARIRELIDERSRFYLEADHRILTDNRMIDEICDEILKLMREPASPNL